MQISRLTCMFQHLETLIFRRLRTYLMIPRMCYRTGTAATKVAMANFGFPLKIGNISSLRKRRYRSSQEVLRSCT